MNEQPDLEVARYVAAAPLTIAPVILSGTHVQLVPLTAEHHAALCAVGLEEQLWRWSPQSIKTHEDMRAYIETALAEQTSGKSLPFATALQASGQIVGSTRYGNIDRQNRHSCYYSIIDTEWPAVKVGLEQKMGRLQGQHNL